MLYYNVCTYFITREIKEEVIDSILEAERIENRSKLRYISSKG
jgi:ferritin-like protein